MEPLCYDQTSLKPKYQLNTYDSNINRVKTFYHVIIPPNIAHVYIKHFATKTIEYIEKMKKGHANQTLLLNKWIDNFCIINTVIEE